MLTIEHLDQYYGGSHILRDVSLDVSGAACTVLLGRNGVGKTTLLKGIMGLRRAARPAASCSMAQDITRLAPLPARARSASATCRRAARSSTGSRSRRT